jgi:hypothetical protein
MYNLPLLCTYSKIDCDPTLEFQATGAFVIQLHIEAVPLADYGEQLVQMLNLIHHASPAEGNTLC